MPKHLHISNKYGNQCFRLAQVLQISSLSTIYIYFTANINSIWQQDIHVFVKYWYPKRQQSPNMAKSRSTKYWPAPPPGAWDVSEEPIYELEYWQSQEGPRRTLCEFVGAMFKFLKSRSKVTVKVTHSKFMVPFERPCHREYTCQIWKLYLIG